MDIATALETLLPGITVEVTADRLEARAVISARTQGSVQSIERQYILDRLTEAGIVYGVDAAAIDRLADSWNQGLHLGEALVVARGAPPAPAEPGPPELLVAAVTDYATVERVRLLAPTHYQEVVGIAATPAPDRVDPGQGLMSFALTADAQPGMTVDGKRLEPGPPRPPLVLGPGVRFDLDRLAVAAARCGVVLCDGHSVDVLPLIFDARVYVSIAPDGLSCSVDLVADGPGGLPLTVETVASKLAAAGVKVGVIPGAVETVVAEARRDGKATREVAQGRSPQDGIDTRLEYLVDLDVTNAPLIEEGGRVDFKSISVIRSVAAGQPLVRRHPGTKGVPGYTVTGRPLRASNGREVRLPRGRNVVPDPDDPDLLIAKVDGNVRDLGGELEVSECFVVRGDVDYSTGHINYQRSVMIKGDVKGGFNVEVGGDLEVGGLAEDSTIKVGGNVLIRRGFVGQGQGLLEAKGRVLLGFGRNQTVRCSGTLTVEREAINMTLNSRDAVMVAGLLVGGRVSARNRVVCRVLGNAGGTKTDLEVGVDHFLLEQRVQIGESIDQLRRLLAGGSSAKQPPGGLRQFLASIAGPDWPGDQQPLTAEGISSLVNALEDKRKVLLEQAYIPEGACVVVQDKVWPGVQIKIAGSSALKVTDWLPGPLTFRLREGEVRWA